MNRDDQQQDLVLNAFEQVELACREFRGGWKEGKPKTIESVLSRFEESTHLNVFRNLLNIEIEFRRRAKQNPTSEQYIQRFPQFARLIRQAFFMSTMMSMQGSVATPMTRSRVNVDDHPTMSFVVPAANQLGDYHLIQEIGRGGFGVVYEARHKQRQNFVALKTLPIGMDAHGQDDADRLHKFRREFRSLADINHPNLIGMQTLEVDGNQWFFTMDLIDGDDFLSYVRPNNELDEERLRTALPQLANGIMALHGQRIIHRDLKPSNVRVDTEGKVTILDFGLVVELAQRTDQTMSLQSARFAGTPVYAAPEQFSAKTTSASDWYAFGVMLFEALTGKRPFQGTLAEIIGNKQHHDPPTVSGHADTVSDLAKFTDRLLNREPGRRPDALEIAQAFSLETESRSVTTDDDFQVTYSDDGELLVGRDQQLADLEELRTSSSVTRAPSTFNVPVAGALFAVEIILGESGVS